MLAGMSGGMVPRPGRSLAERAGVQDPVPRRVPDPPDERAPGGGPVSLTAEQIGAEPVHCCLPAVAVFAWVPWTDGRYHAVEAFAGQWTSSAVHLRWRERAGGLRDVWVWAAGVRRRE